MEGNLLMVVAGVLLSLAGAYLPGFSGWFGALDAVKKAQVMLALNLLAAGVVAGGSCWLGYGWITCDQAGWKTLLELFFYAMVANQTTYQAIVRPAKAA